VVLIYLHCCCIRITVSKLTSFASERSMNLSIVAADLVKRPTKAVPFVAKRNALTGMCRPAVLEARYLTRHIRAQSS
jgi:hypothetical protein